MLLSYFSLITPAEILDIGLSLAILTSALIIFNIVAESWAYTLDLHLGKKIIKSRTAPTTHIMHSISWFGGPVGITIVTCLYVLGLAIAGSYQEALLFLCILGASIGYVLGIKLLTARKRPTLKVLELERTYSFPSAHSLVSTVVYLSIAFGVYQGVPYAPGLLVVIAFVSLLYFIGLSRVYLGCHYLSDVIAGFIGGLVWAGIYLFLSGLG